MDHKAFINSLSEAGRRIVQVVPYDELDICSQSKAVVLFFYWQSKEAIDALNALITAIGNQVEPFPLLVIDADEHCVPDGRLWNEHYYQRLRDLFGETGDYNAAWLRAGCVFAQDTLGYIRDSERRRELASQRIKQIQSEDGSEGLIHAEPDKRKLAERSWSLFDELEQILSLRGFPPAKERSIEQLNESILIARELVYSKPELLSMHIKSDLFGRLCDDEIMGCGTLEPVIRGDQGTEYPVEMKPDGTFWYGDKKLEVFFRNESDRKRCFANLIASRQYVLEGDIARFELRISVYSESDTQDLAIQSFFVPMKFLRDASGFQSRPKWWSQNCSQRQTDT
jgi:hypothetical protein